MCNQLHKFSPQLTDKTKPLQDLLCSKNQWLWGEAQQKAFVETKKAISCTPVLALYDQKHPTRVSADALSFGLGAVLMWEFSTLVHHLIIHLSMLTAAMRRRRGISMSNMCTCAWGWAWPFYSISFYYNKRNGWCCKPSLQDTTLWLT